MVQLYTTHQLESQHCMQYKVEWIGRRVYKKGWCHMLQVTRDNTITIHKGDAFSLLCASNDAIEAEKLFFYATNEANEIVIEKQAEQHENGVYFIFNSNVYWFFSKFNWWRN